MTAGVGLPKIATVMPSSLFGGFDGGPEERKGLLLEAGNYADYLDVGVEMLEGAAQPLEIFSRRTKVVLSWHPNRPLSLEEIKDFVRSWHGCGVYKIAMPAKTVEDNLAALRGCLALEGVKRVVFCYGNEGVLSRVLSPFFGAEWVYSALGRGQETAPGQVDLESLKWIRGALV